MMVEYYALSTAMRDVLPLRDLAKGVASGMGILDDCLTHFKTTVWEDNNGALSLANLEPGQHTPRSRFYQARVHWFRSFITRDGEGETKPDGIFVRKIDTKVQLADLLTKPLPREVFEPLRKLLIGLCACHLARFRAVSHAIALERAHSERSMTSRHLCGRHAFQYWTPTITTLKLHQSCALLVRHSSSYFICLRLCSFILTNSNPLRKLLLFILTRPFYFTHYAEIKPKAR